MHTFATLHPTVFPPSSANTRAAFAQLLRALFARRPAPARPTAAPTDRFDNEVARAAAQATGRIALVRA